MKLANNMWAVLRFPLQLLLFWLLFFAGFRLWFILWFYQEWPAREPSAVWKSFWHALPLDLSMAGYFLIIPVLVWFAGLALPLPYQAYAEKLITVFNAMLIGLMVLVFGSNIFVYEEWHTLLNNRALAYLSTPWVLFDSMSVLLKIASVLLSLVLIWSTWRMYRRMTGTRLYGSDLSRWSYSVLPVLSGAIFLAIRGGLGVMPINESAVYFSPHLFCNHAATNTAWNLFHSLVETRSTENHYRFMDDALAQEKVENLFSAAKAGQQGAPVILNPSNGSKFNVVFIVMESMTAQLVEELGGEPGVCPNLSRLMREGVLFENIYGSGYRTDQGLISILAGYPAQPDQSIVLLSDKAEKLPSIPKTLSGAGYATAFFYGGELTFANIGQWLTAERFEKIYSDKDFAASEKTQRWGVDDKIMLQRAIKETGGLPQPFFTTLMTLSLHPPYDVPYKSKWSGLEERERCLNAAAFADYAIGTFFQEAEQQAWYRNTLFLLVADHGSSNPGRLGLDNPKARHIPLILFGQPIAEAWKGRHVKAVGNHHDIPATILPLLGYPAEEFEWSRNLLLQNPNGSDPGFAYYTNESGLGWVIEDARAFYSFGNGRWEDWEGNMDPERYLEAKAYLQTFYNDFLKK